jgi:hypothetical protein
MKNKNKDKSKDKNKYKNKISVIIHTSGGVICDVYSSDRTVEIQVLDEDEVKEGSYTQEKERWLRSQINLLSCVY